MATTDRLHKSSRDKMLFGVAGGLAEYLAVDPVLVRVGFAVLTFAGGAGIWAYIILAIVMPSEETQSTEGADIVRENVQAIAEETAGAARRIGEAVEETLSPEEAEGRQKRARRRRNTFAVALIVIGALFLLLNIGAFSWFNWGGFWPVILIGLGAAILYGRYGRL